MQTNPITRGKQHKDLTGTRFGRLLVIGEGQHRYYGNKRMLYWKCKCDCGAVKDIAGQSLKVGCSTSCGCYHNEVTARINFKHGIKRSPAYSAWCNMRNRCYREKDDYFHCYGGRGIKVCDSWHDFENFYRDMGDPPKGMCLDRKDNDGDYSPDNCHWTTQKVQQRNRRNNHMLSFNGETLCISEWSERTGINHRTIGQRVRKGWPIEKVLNFNIDRRCCGE